ncbi:MAG: ABC transporter ATP-binding protein [Conexivisphaerales archaeon]
MSFLEVAELKKYFPVQHGLLEQLTTRKQTFVKAVDGVSFSLARGDIYGLVGESGSGKTTTGRLTIGLLKPTSGKVVLDGIEVQKLDGTALRKMRRRMQIIFQDPTASLSPKMKVGDAVADAIRLLEGEGGPKAKKRVLEMFEYVGLTPAREIYGRYPSNLSGGQKQRVVIARALITRPEYVVADEPVAMVDVSVRAQILDVMRGMHDRLGLTYLFITHDLAVAKYLCNKIGIMYLGRIAEQGDTKEIFRLPLHPYTQALLAAVPVPDPSAKKNKNIPHGEIPNAINPPPGCRFNPRCPFATEVCRKEEPPLRKVDPSQPTHLVACHWAEKFL